MPNLPIAARLALAARALVGVFSERQSGEAARMLTGIFPGATGLPPTRGTREMLSAYSQMPWLRAIVGKIAQGTAAVDWKLYVGQKKGATKAYRDLAIQRAPLELRYEKIKQKLDTGELREIEGEHPFLTMLATANSFMTGLDLRRLTQAYTELVGEWFWLKERNGAGAPVAVWPLPPNWILSTPTPTRRMFRVSFRGWQGEIPDTEILWGRDLDPENPYGRGTGIARALSDELETDEYTAKTLKQWFFNRARPDLIISPKSPDTMGKDDTERLERSWMQKNQGFWRAYRPFFTSREITVFPLEQDFRSQQLVQLRQHERDTIIQVWGVSPEVLGVIENSNRATIDAADYLFSRHVLVPRLESMRAILQEFLIPEYDERLILDYVSPVQEDKEFALKAATIAPWALRVDEHREMMGLDPLEAGEGEVFMVASGVKPVASLDPEDAAFAPPPSPFGAPGAPGTPPGAPNEPPRPGTPPDEPPAKSLRMTKDALERLAARLEPAFRDVFLRAAALARGSVNLEQLAEAVLANRPEVVEQIIALDRFTAELDGAIPILRQGFAQAGALAAQQLGTLGIDMTFDARHPRAAGWAANHGAQLVREVTETTRQAIRDIVSRAVTDGVPPRTAALAIRDVVGLTVQQAAAVDAFRARLVADEVDDAVVERRVAKFAEAKVRERALTIARTETIAASNNGQQELWRQAQAQGFLNAEDTVRTWIVTNDDRLDLRVCEPMDGQEVGLEEPFTTGTGEHVMVPPAHPACRCAVGLVVRPPKQETQAEIVAKAVEAMGEAIREGLAAAMTRLGPRKPSAKVVAARDAQGFIARMLDEDGVSYVVDRAADGQLLGVSRESPPA